ncbi:MAG: 2Fe-2S iron-sulfur cluster binding domain-containing protein [Deltaproteobacteria bacterium]|nr:2Fe-2S iron-sulfur cluster binding domain-containing protein [Deltaproteobacteria bacterium]MBW2389229.1 2Fe-2S iron-sulfur cluster binding domain-containing protein [Deltaproteobacteria bacterium]
MLEMVVQGVGLLIVAAALAEIGLAIVSRLRRFSFEQSRYDVELEDLEERLMTARVRRVDRERESQSWNGIRKFRVAKKVEEGGDIISFYFEAHDGKPIPSHQPGQFLTFSLKLPEKKRPEVRCYSLSDKSNLQGYRVSIKRVPPPRNKPDVPPGKVSNFFHDHIQEGDIVDCLAPGGDFFLDPTHHSPIVLIAGGIGLTPMVAMLNSVAERGFDREVWLFYGVRDAREQVMMEHLTEVARKNPEHFKFNMCYSKEDLAALPPNPDIEYHGERVSVDLFKRTLPSNNFQYYICGPPPLMDSITHDLREWGVPDSSVHFESFGPASVSKTPKAEEVAAHADSSLTISFSKSGEEFAWDPAAGNILAFALDKDIDIPSGCRAGSCGTCVSAIKSGDIEYLKPPSQKPDDGSCLTCISVPKTNLVIDA